MKGICLYEYVLYICVINWFNSYLALDCDDVDDDYSDSHEHF